MINRTIKNLTEAIRRQIEPIKPQMDPYEIFYDILIFLSFLSIFFYILVLYPIIRYRKIFFDSHYFFKAAFQLAFMDMSGLTLNILYYLCNSCLPMLTRWVPYFMTQTMLVIIAFNRFSAVVLYKYYSTMYKSRLATWAFLVPITIAIGLCGPTYSSVICEQFNTTCWYYNAFYKLDFTVTLSSAILIVSLYVAIYIYQRFFNTLNQMNERRFLYQAAINASFFVILYIISEIWPNTNRLATAFVDFFAVVHFGCAPFVYLLFNRKLRRYVLHCISCGRFELEGNSVHAVQVGLGTTSLVAPISTLKISKTENSMPCHLDDEFD